MDLLTEKHYKLAMDKSNRSNQYNETRKDLDQTMTEEANRKVANL